MEHHAHQRLSEPLALGRLQLANRLAVAPMTRVSASAQGLPTPHMADYYRGFAEGGFGLVITEGLYTDEDFSQGYLFQPGMANEAQQQAWRGIIAGVQAQGARMLAQLMHAGALSQGNPHRVGTVGPSAVQPVGRQMPFYRGSGAYPLPAAMAPQEIDHAVQGFALSARRARQAGFDGVEIHGANGYLLDQFLSEGSNLREDGHGGALAGRLRLICEVAWAVRAAVGPDFVVGLRISQAKVNDFACKWRGGEAEARALFELLGRLPLDYLHTTEHMAWQPAFGIGPSLAALAKRYAGLPVLANGGLHDPARAAGMLARGEADFVALGRGALTHPDWPRRVAQGLPLSEFDAGLLAPIADLAHADLHRAAARAALERTAAGP
ncbi:NADH:flavin oxidoreductase [Pseudorhodoferax soli]|uniref:2,4-dienoyl-CoA reductase-like NADH-dependent reductase (Old Yellow Enzyme family) n=1 Tax=Pseudorhodoferax soli TaxID=545864 RepID=A0A368Y7N5_9BURK|nr:NADH:flavin oxidoreductase [Pseudorhodoferax soli]RCW75699.1 2,4-dienoyl-CoA reductase-like NADH-dependent reductase (Old Yellow Enzyme family) [Pseudorhodoferax soli]